jgi:hypothetical protein
MKRNTISIRLRKRTRDIDSRSTGLGFFISKLTSALLRLTVLTLVRLVSVRFLLE